MHPYIQAPPTDWWHHMSCVIEGLLCHAPLHADSTHRLVTSHDVCDRRPAVHARMDIRNATSYVLPGAYFPSNS